MALDMHLYCECGGTRLEDSKGVNEVGRAMPCGLRRVPFVIVTEAAVNRECDRDLAWQNIEKEWDQHC